MSAPHTPHPTEAARFCHAASARVAPDADADGLAEAYAVLTRRHGLAGGRLWVERVPAGLAVRRRDAELARPLPVGGPDLRAVLLRHDDGADLVLVARRHAVGRHRLGTLLAELTDPAAPGSSGSDADAPASASADVADASASDPDAGDTGWLRGDPGPDRPAAHIVAVPAGTDLAALVAAVGAVLARYRGVRRALVGAVVDERLAVVGVPVDGGARDLLATAAATGSPWPVAGGAPPAGFLDVEVGVLDAASPADAYRPCLAPLWPLTLALAGTTLTCHHRTAGWSGDLVAAFARQVVRVLGQVLADPDRPLAGHDLFDDAERAAIVALGRGPGGPPPAVDTIAGRVARHARRRPDAPAVSCAGQRLTYAQLDAAATRVARALAAHGVAPGDRVGVCLDRSVDLIAVLLGVLRAGAAYVPVDPAYPAERIRYTVEDSGVALLVGGGGIDPAGLTAGPDDAAGKEPAAGGPDDTAYVIYTSGSTGRPKGVCVPHRNVLALVDATAGDFGLGPADVWTMFHSSAFDFSVWEIWGCLLTGGHLVVVPHLVTRSPQEFHALLAAERVTVLNQTPSAFAQLLDVDRRAADRLAVRLVVFGGEPLDARMLTGWFDRHPERECRVVNMFGITETTVHVTAQTLDRGLALAGSRSVGRALPGWRVYVLDPDGRLLPPGAAGEIHVGGAGVADGYLHRPELTAQRFRPDPWAGGRMYRSGDRGRLLPDGRLEHLGRLDDQVKVRGYRIELDEIRQVLLDDPGVLAVAVVVQTGAESADTRLHAYVVLADPAAAGTAADPAAGAAVGARAATGVLAEVRRRAARMLPDYMVPATVTALPALPLTGNGKLDTARLPAPAELPASAPAPAADAALDERIRAVWQRVLGAEVGPEDNFFDLGGNSLLALRLLNELRDQGLADLTPRHLYVHQTVRGLAEAIGAAR
ncbi:amino acid adenylation domain-containing protein [Micromonospora haikouensis]|uniref:Amino acid adenylation domain-containing protein n=1 Tax=Micromonospora haikouensis TaxID=686309 RepID=A0A1C4XIQ3_9ACTN|nr:amino acid adenylation domain-containing protein [Micromonospora haikouensis]SCF08380.1 amino acid adenylation domain-containing protein [Micromonospora haikouensis]